MDAKEINNLVVEKILSVYKGIKDRDEKKLAEEEARRKLLEDEILKEAERIDMMNSISDDIEYFSFFVTKRKLM